MLSRQLAAVLYSAALLTPASAQCLDWTGGFAAPGTDRTVYDSLVHDDGSGSSIFIAGSFRRAGEIVTTGVARWDGTTWNDVGGGVDHADPIVRKLIVFNDGSGPKLFAAGRFDQAGTLGANSIARWDGSSWSPLGAGIAGTIFDMGVYDSGAGDRLVVTGDFHTAGGHPANYIAAWDGSGWNPLGAGLDDRGNCLAVYDSGSGPALFAGGAFDTAGGSQASRIATWDGTQWSSVGGGVTVPTNPHNSKVQALFVHNDGAGQALFVGGRFDLAGSSAVKNVARWDGATWLPVGPPSLLGGSVNMLSAHDDGFGVALYAGGGFVTHNGAVADGLARWYGQAWSSVGQGFLGAPLAMTSYDDGSGVRLIVGGYIQTIDYAHAGYLAAWDGTQWSLAMKTSGSPQGEVHALELFDDGLGEKLYLGGQLARVDDMPTGNVASWDGSSWTGTGLNGNVFDLEVYDDGTSEALYAGGQFLSSPGNGIALWDGTSWSSPGSGLTSSTGTSVYVSCMTTMPDSQGAKLVVGGQFTQAGPHHALNIATWDGAQWAPLGSGLGGTVSAVASIEEPGGHALYAAWRLWVSYGTYVVSVSRWNGTSWTNVGTVSSRGSIGVLEPIDIGDGLGTQLVAAGNFSTIGGVAAQRIARWNGSQWSSLGTGLGGPFTDYEYVNDIAVFRTTPSAFPSIYAVGNFTTASGQEANSIARIEGSEWRPVGAGLQSASLTPGAWTPARVFAIQSFRDGSAVGDSLFVAGRLDYAGEFAQRNIARLADPCATCAPAISPYCVGELHSLGCTPHIFTEGTPSTSSPAPFTISAGNALPTEGGFLIYGPQRTNLDFHGGKLCVRVPFQRLHPVKPATPTGTPPCSGILRRNFNKAIQTGADPSLTAGRRVFAQWIQRDPADPGGGQENLTNGVRFTVCP